MYITSSQPINGRHNLDSIIMTIENNSNSHIVFINGNSYLFSYDTLVAMNVDRQLFRTDKKWSNTTSKHINAYFGRYSYSVDEVKNIPQTELDNYTL